MLRLLANRAPAPATLQRHKRARSTLSAGDRAEIARPHATSGLDASIHHQPAARSDDAHADRERLAVDLAGDHQAGACLRLIPVSATECASCGGLVTETITLRELLARWKAMRAEEDARDELIDPSELAGQH